MSIEPQETETSQVPTEIMVRLPLSLAEQVDAYIERLATEKYAGKRPSKSLILIELISLGIKQIQNGK